VNSLADPGNGPCNATQCTLREAINDPQTTEISFAPGLTGRITLARPGAGGGTLRIEKTLSITGPSRGIVIRRRSTDPAFRIVRIGSGVTVKLTNLSIRNGKDDHGGGIINFGTLALTQCTVAGNRATLRGGGIDNHGPLTVTSSTVAGNSGGGIFSQDHRLTLTRSTVADNAPVGIFNQGGTLALRHSTVAGNSGRGIASVRGTATLSHARIIGNSHPFRGGGILASDTRVTVTHSTIAFNSATLGFGGGIGSDGSRLTLTNSTVSGNSARFAGGIANGTAVGASITLTNSTVARNSATELGGGILQTGEEARAFLVLTNSLVAENSAPTGPDVFIAGGAVAARFNLIGDGSGSGITSTDGNQVGSASQPIDPKLGPLANNGGLTQTHALLLGSPAIDAASTPDCPSTDQRGVLRPQGVACDIGSFERR
jgi:trimeric autotransporter adhesin